MIRILNSKEIEFLKDLSSLFLKYGIYLWCKNNRIYICTFGEGDEASVYSPIPFGDSLEESDIAKLLKANQKILEMLNKE